MRAPLSLPNEPLRTIPTNTITLRIKASAYEFERWRGAGTYRLYLTPPSL
jgi:hypothetical protein